MMYDQIANAKMLRIAADFRQLKLASERLEWYKKRSIFAKWATQNNADALVATNT